MGSDKRELLLCSAKWYCQRPREGELEYKSRIHACVVWRDGAIVWDDRARKCCRQIRE